MKKYHLIIVTILLFLMMSCSTTLANKNVIDSSLRIKPLKYGLIPGCKYNIESGFLISPRFGDANWEYDVDSEEIYIEFTSLESRLILHDSFYLPEFSFDLINNPQYIFTVKTLTNPYPDKLYTYNVSWELGNSWIHVGKHGKKNYGGNGGIGPNLVVEAAYYDVSGTALEGTGTYILVYSPTNGKVMLVKANKKLHTIKTLGGTGGEGAEGRDKYAGKDNPVVYGGDGRRGGDGGDGGHISFRYPVNTESILAYFILDASGGSAGEGGSGGRGDEYEEDEDFGFFDALQTLFGENFGEKGDPGRTGRNGSIQKTPLNLDHMFLNLDMDGFERERLLRIP
ncbi:MAG: hypothetical protein GY760_21600 [Deltaproteobacteria bacterium]|nr:hypothetical protein [Deltaproteobacteria bacterium]